ncbi:Dual specificity mitogen-activated protein kinase kinase 6, partial [Ophiophagus hannah]
MEKSDIASLTFEFAHILTGGIQFSLLKTAERFQYPLSLGVIQNLLFIFLFAKDKLEGKALAKEENHPEVFYRSFIVLKTGRSPQRKWPRYSKIVLYANWLCCHCLLPELSHVCLSELFPKGLFTVAFRKCHVDLPEDYGGIKMVSQTFKPFLGQKRFRTPELCDEAARDYQEVPIQQASFISSGPDKSQQRLNKLNVEGKAALYFRVSNEMLDASAQRIVKYLKTSIIVSDLYLFLQGIIGTAIFKERSIISFFTECSKTGRSYYWMGMRVVVKFKAFATVNSEGTFKKFSFFFSPNSVNKIKILKKNSTERPTYPELMQHTFFIFHESKETDVASFVKLILEN